MIVSAIAPNRDSRDAIKDTILHTAGAGGNFYTVHVATPLEHCEETDRRNVYKRARNGELKGVAGVDEVYETPERAELVVNVATQSVPEIVHSESSSILVYTISILILLQAWSCFLRRMPFSNRETIADPKNWEETWRVYDIMGRV